MSPEKFCLKWTDFHTNITSSLQEMRSDQEFADVTLVCGDNQRIEAHKVILSSASSFFRSILYGNKHSHPMIYMRGIKFEYLEAAIDLIYHGETNIYQDDLDDFLQMAAELELKGLTTEYGKVQDSSPQPKTNSLNFYKESDSVFQNNLQKKELSFEETKYNNLQTLSLVEQEQEICKVLPFGIEQTELEEIIKSMLKSVDGTWTCTKCGRNGPSRYNMKRHIETHIEGISLPCKHCGKTFRSSNCMQAHIYRSHTMK